jgi:hypothetical protein
LLLVDIVSIAHQRKNFDDLMLEPSGISGKAEVGFAQIVFSNGSRAGVSSGFDAFGCLRSLRARSALDGVSWVQGG